MRTFKRTCIASQISGPPPTSFPIRKARFGVIGRFSFNTSYSVGRDTPSRSAISVFDRFSGSQLCTSQTGVKPLDSGAQGQTCKHCGKRDAFDFHVSNETWARIVPEALQQRVVCLWCFDQFAKERGVSFAKEITTLYFAGENAVFHFTPKVVVDLA
ncbi:MAG TPA: hypothetical protein VGC27_03155 [Rhizomicrobium sp.]